MIRGVVMFRLILPADSDTLVLQGLVSLLRGLRSEWRFDDVAREDLSSGDYLLRVEHVESGRWLALLDGQEASQRAARALNAGASAVVLQRSSVADLERGIQSILNPVGAFVPDSIVRALANRAIREKSNPPFRNGPSLSGRETEVLGLISQGDTNREVARKLGISVNTVRTHIQALSTKLNVSGRVNLAGAAWRNQAIARRGRADGAGGMAPWPDATSLDAREQGWHSGDH
jgi:DNA-binding NarL/FixJ family response regulator